MSRITSSLTAKIIIALLIACATLLISKRVAEYSFGRIMNPIQQLSKTSPQLELVNRLFKNIVQLDHDQRVYADQNTSINYVSFINTSKNVRNMLDSVEKFNIQNREQIDRINRMKHILDDRNKLFIQYLNLRNQYRKNDSLSSQINQLSDFINFFSERGDSSLYSNQSNITHTVVENEIPDTVTKISPSKRTFIDRMLGKKTTSPTAPPPIKEISHYVYEQMKTSVDTATLKREDSIINQYSNAIAHLENTRKLQLKNIGNTKTHFEQANSKLINEMLTIVNEMEETELQKSAANNLLARNIIKEGVSTSNKILITFMVLTVVFAFLIFLDIIRSNRYKKQLIAAKEQADELSSIKQKFLANMSHELRTPLQSIAGYSELMLHDKKLQTEKNLQIVNQSSLHLLNIVNQILDYSSISTNNFTIQSKPFSIKKLLEEVYTTIIIHAKEKGLQLTTNIDDVQDENIKGDAFRLKQILLNLLNNAVKFTQYGSVQLDIDQQIGKAATAYTFSITDTGIGISRENLDKIFNEFEQLNATQLHNGNGLGLSITQKIVEKLNGTISASSEVGKGSSFTVQLLFQHAIEAVGIEATSLATPSSIDVSNGLVWLIDDDRYMLELCSKILSKHQIRYQCFHSSNAILNEKIPIDLKAVLMDIRMPDISGFDLLPILKEKFVSHTSSQVQFVALTAQVLPEETEDIFRRGFDRILHKPFLENDLLALLHTDVRASSNDNTNEEDEIAAIFREETTKDLQEIDKYVEKNEYPPLAMYFHKIASRLGQMGYTALWLDARKLEIAIRSGQSPKESVNKLCMNIREVL